MRLIAILQLSCLVVLQVQILFSVLEFGFLRSCTGSSQYYKCLPGLFFLIMKLYDNPR